MKYVASIYSNSFKKYYEYRAITIKGDESYLIRITDSELGIEHIYNTAIDMQELLDMCDSVFGLLIGFAGNQLLILTFNKEEVFLAESLNLDSIEYSEDISPKERAHFGLNGILKVTEPYESNPPIPNFYFYADDVLVSIVHIISKYLSDIELLGSDKFRVTVSRPAGLFNIRLMYFTFSYSDKKIISYLAKLKLRKRMVD